MGLGADIRQQDTRVESLSQQLAESQRVNAELRGQVCGTGCVGRYERMFKVAECTLCEGVLMLRSGVRSAKVCVWVGKNGGSGWAECRLCVRGGTIRGQGAGAWGCMCGQV